MTSMFLFRIPFLLFFSVLNLVSLAQDEPFVNVLVEKKSILLGEPLLMTIEAKFPTGKGISFNMPDTIPHFEFLEKPSIDSQNKNGLTILKVIYKLTSFDSGHWVIPSFPLSRSVKSDTVGVDVVFSDFNPEQPYHDIKDIIEVKAKSKNQWWWYAAAGGLLLLLLAVYLLRKKKAPPVVKNATVIDPYKEATKRLEELQRQKTTHKEYYSALTDIFRLYIFKRKGILSLQKTTDDLVVQLKNIGLPASDFEKLSQALRLSDFVKFAKYTPAPEDDKTVYNEILSALNTIEKLEVKVPL